MEKGRILVGTLGFIVGGAAVFGVAEWNCEGSTNPEALARPALIHEEIHVEQRGFVPEQLLSYATYQSTTTSQVSAGWLQGIEFPPTVAYPLTDFRRS